MFSLTSPAVFLTLTHFFKHLTKWVWVIFLIGSAARAVTVGDDAGHVITLAKPAQRIVSLAPHITELLFASGTGNAVIAVSDYSDYPDAARRLPSVGGSQGLDLERIAALKPDLVMAWQSGNSAGQLEAIERLGIPVFRSEPKTLEDVATSLERFGAIGGHEQLGKQAARDFRQRAENLRRQYSADATGEAPLRVFYQVWNRPLMTVGGPHLISKIIELCGGRNIFVQLDALAPIVDAEAVIVANPELIVISSTTPSAIDAESLGQWKKWPQIAAVRDRNYLGIDPSLIGRHTPRILDGAEQLCKAIAVIRLKASNLTK